MATEKGSSLTRAASTYPSSSSPRTAAATRQCIQRPPEQYANRSLDPTWQWSDGVNRLDGLT